MNKTCINDNCCKLYICPYIIVVFKKKKIKYFVETQLTKAQLNFIYSFLKWAAFHDSPGGSK